MSSSQTYDECLGALFGEHGRAADGMLIASLIRYDECMRRALFGEHGGQLPTLRRDIEPSVTPLFLFNFSRFVNCL